MSFTKRSGEVYPDADAAWFDSCLGHAVDPRRGVGVLSPKRVDTGEKVTVVSAS